MSEKSQSSGRASSKAAQIQQHRHEQEQAQQQEEERDEANKRRFIDQSGIVAQDLPGAEHGQNVVDPPEEMTRNLPQQHGGEILDDSNAEGGLRGAREMSDADEHGNRKHN